MAFQFLRDGTLMPIIGFGSYLLKGDALKQALDFALFTGYRHIDTALSYGNETEVGEIVADRIKKGTVRRKDLFITTKVPRVYLTRTSVQHSVQLSLDNLKLKYVDMLLIHHPWGCVNRGDGSLKPANKSIEQEFQHYDIIETWKGFEKASDDKLTRNIGISNFTARQIERIYEKARIPPSNLQSECHAYLQQRQLRNYCASRKIILSAYAPLGTPAYPERDETKPILLHDPVVEQLSKKYKKSPAQILLNFLVKSDVVVLPKTQNESHLRENFDITNWTLSQQDRNLLLNLDCGVKYFTFDWAKKHPEYFEHEAF